jgi:hypothetical protein
VLLEERLDEVKVEDVLEHLEVVLGGVEDLNIEVADLLRADLAQVNIGDVGDLVGCDGLGGLVDLVGDAFRCRCTVCEVVLDTEVLVGASGIVASSQQDTTSGLAYADDVASSWCAEDAILADQQLLDTVGGTDLGDQLSDFGVPVTAITTNDEGGALNAFGDGQQDAGNESLRVVVLLENLDLLAQARTVVPDWLAMSERAEQQMLPSDGASSYSNDIEAVRIPQLELWGRNSGTELLTFPASGPDKA